MVWFWMRGDEQLQLETRYDDDTSEFVVTVNSPDGHCETERFEDMDVFRKRLILLERQLEAKNWKNSGPPLFVPEGFPNRRLR
jgi:hypothetical protein